MKRFISNSVVLAGLGLVVLTTEAGAVGTRRVALRSSEDFAAGELVGVAVDSVGRVRAGLNLGSIEVPDATTVWSALRTKRGTILLTTGNEGKLLEYDAGKVKQVGKADALALTSSTLAWGDTVILASLPGGKLYEYKDGQLREWLQLKDEEHIFQLAFDPKEQVLYAATGPNGKLYRITRDKKAQVYFDAEEQHLTSVAVGNGKVYVGGGEEARLYELTAPGRASVLYDFGRTEVRAIVVGPQGDIFAIANELKSKRSLPSSKPDKEEASPSTPTSSSAKGKGTLYRFDRNGRPEQLLDDSSEHFTALALDARGNPFVGTGGDGKLYTIDANRNSVLMADVEQRQVTALLLEGAERHVFASDPLVVHPVRGMGGADSVWTSPVLDSGLRARYGRLEWVSEGQLEFETRSGNSAEPDDTWSPWSAPMTAPGDVASPGARFLQLRARFARDPNAVLTEVSIPFVTDNLRAVVTSIDFENAASRALLGRKDKLDASGGPISGKPQQVVEIKWQVDNPDKDEMRYRLEYRREGTSNWFDILDPNEVLTKSSYSWETEDLPEGRYQVRVTGTDSLANPPEASLNHQLESHVVIVDNTPPVLDKLTVNGRTLSGVARDGVGPIARIEVSVAGSELWVPVGPSDGVLDESSETFRIDLSSVAPSGPALLAVRAYDQEKNQVVASVVLR